MSAAPSSPVSQLLKSLGITRSDLDKKSNEMRQFLSADATFQPQPGSTHHHAAPSSSSSSSSSSSNNQDVQQQPQQKQEIHAPAPTTPAPPVRRYGSMEEVLERKSRQNRKERKMKQLQRTRSAMPPSPTPSTASSKHGGESETFAKPISKYYREHTLDSITSKSTTQYRSPSTPPPRSKPAPTPIPKQERPASTPIQPDLYAQLHALLAASQILQQQESSQSQELPVTPQRPKRSTAIDLTTPLPPSSPPIMTPSSSPVRPIVNLVSSPPRPLPPPPAPGTSMLPYTLPPPPYSYEKPTKPYAALIGQAILASPQHRLTLQEIYDYMSTVYPYFRRRPDGGTETWMNSVRHVLSTTVVFRKCVRERRVGRSLWAIWDDDVICFAGGNYKKKGKETYVLQSPVKQQQQKMKSESEFGDERDHVTGATMTEGEEDLDVTPSKSRTNATRRIRRTQTAPAIAYAHPASVPGYPPTTAAGYAVVPLVYPTVAGGRPQVQTYYSAALAAANANVSAGTGAGAGQVQHQSYYRPVYATATATATTSSNEQLPLMPPPALPHPSSRAHSQNPNPNPYPPPLSMSMTSAAGQNISASTSVAGLAGSGSSDVREEEEFETGSGEQEQPQGDEYGDIQQEEEEEEDLLSSEIDPLEFIQFSPDVPQRTATFDHLDSSTSHSSVCSSSSTRARSYSASSALSGMSSDSSSPPTSMPLSASVSACVSEKDFGAGTGTEGEMSEGEELDVASIFDFDYDMDEESGSGAPELDQDQKREGVGEGEGEGGEHEIREEDVACILRVLREELGEPDPDPDLGLGQDEKTPTGKPRGGRKGKPKPLGADKVTPLRGGGGGGKKGDGLELNFDYGFGTRIGSGGGGGGRDKEREKEKEKMMLKAGFGLVPLPSSPTLNRKVRRPPPTAAPKARKDADEDDSDGGQLRMATPPPLAHKALPGHHKNRVPSADSGCSSSSEEEQIQDDEEGEGEDSRPCTPPPRKTSVQHPVSSLRTPLGPDNIDKRVTGAGAGERDVKGKGRALFSDDEDDGKPDVGEDDERFRTPKRRRIASGGGSGGAAGFGSLFTGGTAPPVTPKRGGRGGMFPPGAGGVGGSPYRTPRRDKGSSTNPRSPFRTPANPTPGRLLFGSAGVGGIFGSGGGGMFGSSTATYDYFSNLSPFRTPGRLPNGSSSSSSTLLAPGGGGTGSPTKDFLLGGSSDSYSYLDACYGYGAKEQLAFLQEELSRIGVPVEEGSPVGGMFGKAAMQMIYQSPTAGAVVDSDGGTSGRGRFW